MGYHSRTPFSAKEAWFMVRRMISKMFSNYGTVEAFLPLKKEVVDFLLENCSSIIPCSLSFSLLQHHFFQDEDSPIFPYGCRINELERKTKTKSRQSLGTNHVLMIFAGFILLTGSCCHFFNFF